jgi:1-acyl-sn-glycerol-3-phosphate acyltransferase
MESMEASISPDAARPPTLRQRLFGCGLWGMLALALLLLLPGSGMGFRTPWARPLARNLVRGLLRLAGISVEARGLQHLPPGPHVLLINHASFFDPIALVALLPARPGYAFVTRQQYRRQVVLWPLVRSLGVVVLERPAGSYTANVSLLREHLSAGECLAVFPEGRFRREPGLQAFHSGIFQAAAAAGVPVVPAGLRGTRVVLPLGSWLPRRTAITLEIGEPVLPARHHPQAADALRQAARKEMLGLCGEGDACGFVDRERC